MNFLAHIFLSGHDELLLVGNFIGDFVKGKQLNNYPETIANGILVHREIDHFTDHHEIVLESKKRLRPKYHHYSPVISDVFYDHFLARLWSDYSKEDLLPFTEKFYEVCNRHSSMIPIRAQRMLSYMSRDNWLYHYKDLEGINQALTGMSRRTPFPSKMDEAADDLKKDYDKYKKEFQLFFPDLQAHIATFIESLK